MTAKELISRYEIYDNGDGRIVCRNRAAVMHDNALCEITRRKPEILAYFAEQREAEQAARKRREEAIAGIEGLAEIKAGLAAIVQWNRAFERSFKGGNACGGLGVGPRPKVDIDALKALYPRAAAYLKAESEAYSSNHEIAAIGKKALEEVIFGDYQKAMRDMEAEISQNVRDHIWD